MRTASPLLFALLLGCPPLASAQPAPPPSHMTDEALAHSEAATRFFGLRRYDDAAQEFQTAYALSGVPELLFNLGRAFEEGNHLADALDAYTRFRAAMPADADHAALDARIETVRRRRAAQASAPPVVVTPPPAPHAPPATRPPPVETPHPAPSPSPRSRALPVALMVGGGVALLGAAALGVSVLVSNASLAEACPNQQCPTPHDDDVASGRARALATDVLGAVGIAALAAGVIVWVVQGPTAARRVAFDARGASLTVRF